MKRKIMKIILCIVCTVVFIFSRSFFPIIMLPVYPLMLAGLMVESHKVKSAISMIFSSVIYVIIYLSPLRPYMMIWLDLSLSFIGIGALLIQILFSNFELYQEEKQQKKADQNRGKNGSIGFFVFVASWNTSMTLFLFMYAM